MFWCLLRRGCAEINIGRTANGFFSVRTAIGDVDGMTDGQVMSDILRSALTFQNVSLTRCFIICKTV
jgi:hypothetical protein